MKTIDELRNEGTQVHETELGKVWKMRGDAGDADHARHSAKWEYYRALYLSTFENMIEAGQWSETVAYAWSVVNALVDDTYFQNPETIVMARAGDPHGDLASEIREVVNTIHADADTEGHMRQSMQTSTWAGFGIHWTFFEQRDREEEQTAINPLTGLAETRKVIIPERQRINGEYVSPWHFRRDPSGRRWDFKDHKWIERRYPLSLKAALESAIFDDDKKSMLKTWAHQNRRDPNVDATPGAAMTEQDPGYLDIEMREIHDLVNNEIIHQPVNASFHMAVLPRPPHFVDAEETPATMIAFNRVPENKQFTEGWWPKPDIELIAPQLEELNRMYGIFMEAMSLSALKILAVKGLIGDEEMSRIEDDKTRRVIPVDLTKIREHLTAAGIMGEKFTLRDLIYVLSPEDSAALVKHSEGIERILSTIAEILGQGPSSRYGLAPARTATESAGLQTAKSERKMSRANLSGRMYDSITRKIWLILRAQQQLPIDYVHATENNDPGVWRQFNAKKVRNIDVMFRHRTGSSRARDMQGEIFALKETAALTIPVLRNAGQTDAAMEIITQLMNLQGIKLATLRPGAREIAKQLAVLRYKAQDPNDETDATSPELAHQNAELLSQLLAAILGPKGLEEVAAAVGQGGAGQPNTTGEPGGLGTGQGPASQGETAFRAGAAGAGMTNIGG